MDLNVYYMSLRIRKLLRSLFVYRVARVVVDLHPIRAVLLFLWPYLQGDNFGFLYGWVDFDLRVPP